MAQIRLKGMTWDHRRAVEPLIGTLSAFRQAHPDIDVSWEARPLSGFEFTPVRELADRYDLIVLDHPFAGDIAEGRYLLPLDEIAPPETAQAFVGPSLETYRYGDSLWALPIDAATQVAVSRPDLLKAMGSVPGTWAETLALGHAARRKGLSLAIGLKGVHSLMTFFSLMANLGTPCAVEPDMPLFERDDARTALSLIKDLLALCPAEALDWNSIALHDQMVGRDDLVFCPAVYCYATYAEADQRRPLRFHEFPGPNGFKGATIGGTGLAVSAACRTPEAAFAYARFLAEAPTQLAFAHHHGQPARVEAWDDKAVNTRFGNCYRDTRATQDGSWVRPRYKGYLTFQEEAGDLIEAHLRGEVDEGELLDDLLGLHGRGV
ncbi:MAG: ABC transporter substrate-binding protein [Parvibaculaceae bacterium]